MTDQVGSYQLNPFPNPVPGMTPETVIVNVRGQDNAIAKNFNLHDADGTIHVQSSTLANRPAAGTAGRLWITTDEGLLYFDNGTNWILIPVLTPEFNEMLRLILVELKVMNQFIASMASGERIADDLDVLREDLLTGGGAGELEPVSELSSST